MVCAALPKRPKQSRKQTLRAYHPNRYIFCDFDPIFFFSQPAFNTNFRGEWTANVENVGQVGQIRPTRPSFGTRPTDYERIPYDPRAGNNNWNTLGNGRRPPLPSSDAESNQGPDLSPRPQRPLQPISTDLGAGNEAAGQAGQVETGKDNKDKVNPYQKIWY